ncbi:phospho-N-acetylmuramoyl-pentapeptide-transferase [Limibacter armeniacum]|uniref:phospho-N-acetylmuramoyl-pentapeptide- transferase n=1 Tax=Limibacter armeniacum TaxID=466084 RepID=UPI002FE61A7F
MLYHLFDYLHTHFDLPGTGLFQYITFRAMLTAVFSVLFATIFGKKIIQMLQKMQMGEIVRDLGLEGQMQKQGTPTMGGLIIIGSIVLPVLLFAKLDNIYILLLVISILWTGAIGFVDDYLKRIKKNKDGLPGRLKIVGQVGLGLIVGLTMLYHEDIVVREFFAHVDKSLPLTALKEGIDFQDVKSLTTTFPFFKNYELDYNSIAPQGWNLLTNMLYVGLVIFIITAISNGANITDGLDGLAAGTSGIISFALAIFAYVSGNLVFADYLNIMYIPNSGEAAIFCTALVGACIGFLWYNSYPAQVFMGDTGSLSLGGVIAVLAIILRKELMLPILCGIFLIENVSVIMQVSYFKYTKKKYGEGRRIFRMAPLHHHYQKSNIPEPKIVARFWIVGLILAILTIATLKIR